MSSTLADATWSNTTMLKASVADTIYVSGSATLVRALLRDRLVDLAGLELSLSASATYANGVVHLAYAHAAQEGASTRAAG